MSNSSNSWLIGCAKCSFWFISIVLMLNAAFSIILGLAIQILYVSKYDEFGAHFQFYAIILWSFGLILFFLGAYGLHFLKSNNYIGLTVYGCFVMFIVFLQVLLGFTGLILKGYNKEVIFSKMVTAQYQYTTNTYYEKKWDTLQEKLRCCGIYSYNEWYKVYNRRILPISCCDPESEDCSTNAGQFHGHYSSGCLRKYIHSINYVQTGISFYTILSGLFTLVITISPTQMARRVYKYELI
ncbi:tetraspanin-9-like [Argonauta hians]